MERAVVSKKFNYKWRVNDAKGRECWTGLYIVWWVGGRRSMLYEGLILLHSTKNSIYLKFMPDEEYIPMHI